MFHPLRAGKFSLRWMPIAYLTMALYSDTFFKKLKNLTTLDWHKEVDFVFGDIFEMVLCKTI